MTAADYAATRKRLGTQAEVAARLGVARGTVARRETGALPITTEAALALDALSGAPPKRRPARGKRAAMRAPNAQAEITRLVVAAYGAGLVSAGKASEYLRLPRDVFAAVCAAAGVYPPYDERDIEADIAWARDAASPQDQPCADGVLHLP